jgi:hypothetical protein
MRCRWRCRDRRGPDDPAFWIHPSPHREDPRFYLSAYCSAKCLNASAQRYPLFASPRRVLGVGKDEHTKTKYGDAVVQDEHTKTKYGDAVVLGTPTSGQSSLHGSNCNYDGL